MDASALASAEYWLSWITIAKLAAAFLVAVGVVMEFGFDWISGPFEETVKHARETQIASLETESKRLAAEAEVAKRDIAYR